MQKHKYTFIALTTLFVMYNLILVFNSYEHFPEKLHTNERFPFLGDKPVNEDAYYMLSIAWNIGKGEGFVYNYNQPSTGIQPLSTIIYSLFAVLTINLDLEKWDFIRIIYLLNVGYLLFFGFLMILLIKKITNNNKISYLLILILILFNNGLFRVFTNGLETGLYLNLFLLTIIYSINFFHGKKDIKSILIFSVLLGLTVLSRIDFLVIMLFFFTAIFFIRMITLKKLFLLSLFTVIIICPWFIFVYNITGTIIPSSGSAQISLSFIDILPHTIYMIVALVNHSNPLVFTGGLLPVAFVSLFILLFFLFFRNKQNKNILSGFNHSAIRIYFSWGFSIIPLLLVYVFFFLSSHFYLRYSAPVYIFSITLFYTLFKIKIRNNFELRSFAVIFVILFFAQNYYAFHMGRVTNSHTVTAGIIKKYFPDSLKIGCFQSGIIGYINENVINLDGKVNFEALQAYKLKSLHKYIERADISVIIDWKNVIYEYIDNIYLNDNWIVLGGFNNKIEDKQSILLIKKKYKNNINTSRIPLINIRNTENNAVNFNSISN